MVALPSMSVEWISLTLLIYIYMFVSLFWYLFSLFDYVIDQFFLMARIHFLKVDGLYLKKGTRSSLGDLP